MELAQENPNYIVAPLTIPIGSSDMKPIAPVSTEHTNKKNGSFSSLSFCGECNCWVKKEHYARKHPMKRSHEAKKSIEK
jgi:hypothetical protein